MSYSSCKWDNSPWCICHPSSFADRAGAGVSVCVWLWIHLLDIRQDGWHPVHLHAQVCSICYFSIFDEEMLHATARNLFYKIAFLTQPADLHIPSHTDTHTHLHTCRHMYKHTHEHMHLMIKPFLPQLFSLMYSPWWQQRFTFVIHSYTDAIAHHLINIQWHKHLIFHELNQILHLLPTFPLG